MSVQGAKSYLQDGGCNNDARSMVREETRVPSLGATASDAVSDPR